VHPTAKRNAIAERFVGSIKGECLDHFIVFGEAHLRYIISQYIDHYRGERPHQGKGNRPLSSGEPPEASPVTTKDVVCETRLGGLLNYRRVA
jgi:putative transposase